MGRVTTLCIGLALFMACTEGTGPHQPSPVSDTSKTSDTSDQSAPDTAADTTSLPDVPTHVEGLIEDRLCPTDSTANYDNTGGPFLLNWCTGCHSSLLAAGQRAGAPLGVDLDTPAGIDQQLLRIYARSADHNVTMPPVDGVPTHERTRLGDWITCGAPGLDEAILLSIEPAEPPAADDTTPGTGGPTTSCVDDSDCEGQCPGSQTGCICVQKTQGHVCARPCTTAADCPQRGNFQCTEGVCSKSGEM
jgi:hypothetical protein